MRKLSGSSFKKDAEKLYLLPFVLLLFFVLLFSRSAFAQEEGESGILSMKVTYEAKALPLSKVLKDLRKQLQVRFTYNNEHLSQQPPVTVKVQAVTLETFLKEILKNTDLTYTVLAGGVVITRKEKNLSVAPSPTGKIDMHLVLHGQVISPDGEPLSGVSIRTEETGQRTVTQPDGMFLLTPRENEMVRFSRLGMKPLVYKAIRTSTKIVQLKMDTVVQAIQEVVVNGYQKIDPRLATGSVLKLSAADVLQPGVPSVDKMLQGKVPGLMIINTSGGVNASPKMRMRGTSTLVGNAAPLWVIDGMIRPDPVNISSAQLNNVISGSSRSNFELMGNAISGLNPYDIESLTFLRDAAATAIYGTRAANGVIVITTKRGKEGPIRVSYNTDFSFQSRPSYRHLQLMNSKERVELSRQLQEDHIVYLGGFKESYSYEGLLQSLYAGKITEAEFSRQVGVLETRNTDWFKELYRNQFSMNNSINLSGGSGKTTYYASVMHADNKSAAKEDGNKIYAATLNLRTQVGKRLNLDVTLTSSYRKARTYYDGVNPQTYALQSSRIFSPDDFIPKANVDIVGASGTIDPTRPPLVYNIHNEIAHTSNTSSLHSSTINLNLDYKIGRGLYFHNATNFITDASEGMAYADYYTYYAGLLRGWDLSWTPTPSQIQNSRLPIGGVADMTSSSRTTLGLRNSIEYTAGFFNNRDQFNVSLGNEIRSENGTSRNSTQPGFFPDRGNIFSPTSKGLFELSKNSISPSKNNAVSVYGTVAYNLMNRYIINGTVRVDGSNRFGQQANSKFLPNYSISGRWNAAMESWFPRGWFLTDWQVKASYGTQGNVVSDVSPNLVAQFSSTKVNPVNNLPYLTIKSMPYPDLRWEKTYQWNLGTDIGLINNRLQVGMEFYSKKTVDVVDMLRIPYEYGLEFMYRNGNKMFNKGMELAVTAQLINNAHTQFSLSFNTSKNLNRLSNEVYTYDYYSFFTGGGHLPGKAVSGIYSYIFKGLNHDTGLPEFDKLNLPEKSADPEAFLVYSGQLEPKLTMNVMPSFSYKSFSVSASMFISLGGVKRLNPFFDMGGGMTNIPGPLANADRKFLDRWRKPGDELHTNIPVLMDVLLSDQNLIIPYSSNATVGGSNSLQDITVRPLDAYNTSDLMTVKNNYLRCNSLNLRYTIPAKRLTGTGVRGLSLGFSVNNVFTIANPQLRGQDPETDGVGTNALPLTRQFAGVLNATF